jgi:hypothetical protein
VLVGLTEKFAPLALLPIGEPPVETVYHCMVFPADVALKFVDEPLHIVDDDAPTEVGFDGVVLTEILLETFPLLIVLLILPEVRLVTVTAEVPAVVNPGAVNVPVPAVVTVIDAVNPVCEGTLVLYVTV